MSATTASARPTGPTHEVAGVIGRSHASGTIHSRSNARTLTLFFPMVLPWRVRALARGLGGERNADADVARRPDMPIGSDQRSEERW